MNLKEIQAPIKNEMDEFKKRLKSSISSSNKIIDTVVNYILKRKGKQIRPVFVFLTAGLNGKITDATYRAAILIEILHTATLIHDDVVDDSNYRRGFFSVNALWKSKYSVLIGDYLLSRGLELSVDNDDFKFSLIFVNDKNSNIQNTLGWIMGFRLGRYNDITDIIQSEGLIDTGGNRYIYFSLDDYQKNKCNQQIVNFDKTTINESVLGKIYLYNAMQHFLYT